MRDTSRITGLALLGGGWSCLILGGIWTGLNLLPLALGFTLPSIPFIAVAMLRDWIVSCLLSGGLVLAGAVMIRAGRRRVRRTTGVAFD